MSAPVWCVDLATAFWSKAGPPPPCPRDLRDAISAVRLSLVEMRGVSVTSVCDWFQRIDISVPLTEPNRPLRACLVAWRGEGFAFVDALDDPAERAFSLAHELAHFLRDYARPRDTAVARLGHAIIDVLDGRRLATPAERLHAVLRNVSLGPYTHLLRRDESGRPLTSTEREAEAAADRLALELLAPADAVGEVPTRAALVERLVRAFGLPPGPAATYAALLLPDPPPIDRAVGRLLKR